MFIFKSKFSQGTELRTVRLEIDSTVPIFRISDLSFIYDNLTSLNYNLNDIFLLCKILDLGFKFVPNILSNDIDFFRFLLYDLDNSFINLNKKLFLKNSCKKSNNSHNSSFDSFTTFNFNSIIKSLKSSNFLNNLNLNFFSSNTLEFRYDLFKLIANNNFSLSKNFTHYQIRCIKNFIKMRPFRILQCDKNVGFLLISNENFLSLAHDHLLVTNSTYIKLNENPLDSTINNINLSLLNLFNTKSISKKLYNVLKIKDNNDVKIGHFRILPKLHKNKFGIRPIINCINHPTSKICELIDLLLQPFIVKIPTILKDSQNLIQICNKTFSTSQMFLYSCDFDSLYTNIKPIHAVNILTDFISSFLNNNDFISPLGFKTLLEIIFNNNIFEFEDMFFQQIVGVPMGCKCGPSIANLFLYLIEKSWLNTNSPLVYARFIDDIFYASDTKLDISSFQNHFGYLKLNVIEDTIVNFLDLKISYNSLINKFEFSLYTKPTNTFSYLLPSSNHPSHIFKNIPKSLFIRIRRICTSYIDYLFHARNLYVQLLKRNYDPLKISSISRMVSNINRDNLIPYKCNKESSSLYNQNILFFYNFDKSLPNLNNFISSAAKNNFPGNENVIKPITYIQKNLGSILVHNKPVKTYSLKNYFTSPCNLSNCLICNFVNSRKYIKIKNFFIPILCESSCQSSNIVYFIFCNICNYFYIGETQKSAKVRIYQHLYSIYNFSKNLDKNLSNLENSLAVAEHFSRKNHSLNNFSFSIFQKDLTDTSIRRSIEADLINLFVKLDQPVINKHIPNIKNIKKLSFS